LTKWEKSQSKQPKRPGTTAGEFGIAKKPKMEPNALTGRLLGQFLGYAQGVLEQMRSNWKRLADDGQNGYGTIQHGNGFLAQFCLSQNKIIVL
jgi:hypothetical protein